MFNSKKVDDLNEKLVNIISNIEQNNKEAYEILNLAWNKLSKFEETYEIIRKENNNILPKSDVFTKAYNSIIQGWETIESFLKVLSDKNTNILVKNNILFMFIDTIWSMIFSYSIMISEFQKKTN